MFGWLCLVGTVSKRQTVPLVHTLLAVTGLEVTSYLPIRLLFLLFTVYFVTNYLKTLNVLEMLGA